MQQLQRSQEKLSCAESIALLPEDQKKLVLQKLLKKDEDAISLPYNWNFWARQKQLIPDDPWQIWLVRSGRGFGKTRMAAETIRKWVEEDGVKRIHLVGETPADVRDTMIEGESGILNISPPWFKPEYEPSKRRLTWPNGAMALVFSGANPEQLRGPQCEKGWCDELASFKYVRETWDNLLFGLRLGENPQVMVTTTPKPISLIKEIRTAAGTVLTTGSTYENVSNLTPIFFQNIISKYEGTSKGGQEIYGEELEQSPSALWVRSNIELYRVEKIPPLVRVGIAIDPAVTSHVDSNETGIIVGGIGEDGHGYIFGDKSGRMAPLAWAKKAIDAYNDYQGDLVIGEVNNGGDLIETTLRMVDPHVSYKSVHATKGKYTRAEPISALYEQGKIHHVGRFATLEDQMCTWEPGDESPDRVDALVWLLTELFLRKQGRMVVLNKKRLGL